MARCAVGLAVSGAVLLGTACVLEPTPRNGHDRVVNGVPTSGDPAVVALLLQSPDNLGVCTGTLVESRAVLFAAHCVPEDLEAVLVYFGSDVLAFLDGNDPSEIANASAVELRIDPGWTGNFEDGHDFAVALLDADAPVDPLELNVLPLDLVSEEVRMVGFGHDQVNVVDGELEFSGLGIKREGTSVIEGVEELFVLVDSFGDNAGSCPGDSGGPTFATDPYGAEVLIGVTSFSIFPPDDLELRCAFTSVQARVDTSLDWIIPATTLPPGIDLPGVEIPLE